MINKSISGAMLSIAFALSAQTTAYADDAPDLGFADFDASVESVLNFPAHYSLELDGLATIEFHIRPEWKEMPEYDPVILSALGLGGARYGVLMTREQDAIGLFSGTDWDNVPFDFTDGKSHHVAFIIQGDLTDVYIDGDFAGSLDQGVAEETDLTTLHIGSLDGANNLFEGKLGGLRIWDTAVDPDDLNAFQKQSILSGGTSHPDLETLVAFSEFADGKRNFVLTDNNMTFDELIEDLTIAFDAASQNAADPVTEEPVDTDTVIEDLTPEEEAIFNDDLDALLEEDADPLAVAPDEAVDAPEPANMEILTEDDGE